MPRREGSAASGSVLVAGSDERLGDACPLVGMLIFC
jgi:hypothetical protein